VVDVIKLDVLKLDVLKLDVLEIDLLGRPVELLSIHTFMTNFILKKGYHLAINKT
jgi:hypothetical protein